MTVADLILELSKLDQSLDVLLSDSEYGINHIASLDVRNVETLDWLGTDEHYNKTAVVIS